MESPDILTALLDDPDLAPDLHRLHGAECLAIVPRASLKHVRAALQSRGMDLATICANGREMLNQAAAATTARVAVE